MFKQAGRLWYELLRDTLVKIKFMQCLTDTCIFARIDDRGSDLVGVYADDLLVTATDGKLVDNFFDEMSVLELKDLGKVETFLGMPIEVDPEDEYWIDQELTIDEMLEKHGLKDANVVRTPFMEEDVPENLDSQLTMIKDGKIPQSITCWAFTLDIAMFLILRSQYTR